MVRISLLALLSAACVAADAAQLYRFTDLGNVVGFGTAPSGQRAVRWDAAGAPLDLGELSGGANQSEARAINGAGQIVGISDDGGPAAFRWDAGTMTPLPALQSFGRSFAYGINEAGQVVGQSASAAGLHATRWDGTTPTDLHAALPAGFAMSLARDINDAGQAILWASIGPSDPVFGYLWDAGVALPLASAPNTPLDLNGAGSVVGQVARTAFLMDDEGLHDLNDLIDPADPLTQYQLRVAFAINDAGVIAGIGCLACSDVAQERVFLLTPVPEPSTASLVVAGVVVVVWILRRHRQAPGPWVTILVQGSASSPRGRC